MRAVAVVFSDRDGPAPEGWAGRRWKALLEAARRDTLDHVRSTGAAVWYCDGRSVYDWSLVNPSRIGATMEMLDATDLRVWMLARAFAAGYDRVLLMEATYPTLPGAFIELAVELLAAPFSVVAGQDSAGGYYLTGMNDFYPSVLVESVGGQAPVEDLVDALDRTRANLTLLPEWYGLRSEAGRAQLERELYADAGLAPLTAAVIRKPMDARE